MERGQIAAPINVFDLHTLTVTNTLADTSVMIDGFFFKHEKSVTLTHIVSPS